MNNGKMTAKRLAELALLTAAALIIFIVELQIPPLTEIPGIKPGLANIITVYCVYRYKPWETALVVTARVILGAVFAAGFMTIIFSAAGALLCLLGMIPVSRLFPKLPVWACSIIGAVLHNTGQTAAAVICLGSFAVLGYFPFLLLGGIISGTFTGLCAQFVISRIKSGKGS